MSASLTDLLLLFMYFDKVPNKITQTMRYTAQREVEMNTALKEKTQAE